MNPYHETFQTWNKIAEQYQDKFMNMDLYNASYDLFYDSLKSKKAKVLDVACGPGNISQYLLKKNAALDLLGIDVADNMIALARKNNPTAKFQVMDCRTIAALPDTYDGIISGFFIPYLSFDEIRKFIKDSYQLLNDKGVLYLSFVDGKAEDSGFKRGKDVGRVYFYYHQTEQLIRLLEENSFKNIRIETVSFKRSETETELHTILIATKQ